jgi:hypothetical protein
MDRKYFDDCMCNYSDVYDGDKPLMIVSEGKSTLAYETLVMMAERSNLWVELAMLRCEDGLLHEHAFIGRRNIVPGETNPARAGLDLVFDCKEGQISRSRLQYELGQLLGYPLDDVLDFIASKVARECPCDCCGGPYVSEEITG